MRKMRFGWSEPPRGSMRSEGRGEPSAVARVAAAGRSEGASPAARAEGGAAATAVAAEPAGGPGTAHPGSEEALSYAAISTPIGTLYVAYSGTTVRYTNLDVGEARFERDCLARFGVRPVLEESAPDGLRRAILDYLEGKGPFGGAVDLSSLSDFQERALRKCMEIRMGEIRPYGWIAREIGAPKAARAVGTAMAENPIPILIPCHRVVRADYQIGGYGCGGPEKKRQILRWEGVDVERLEELGRQGVRFIGSKNTHIYCMPSCYTARQVKPENLVTFASEEKAQAAGFRPCKICRPG